MEFVFVLPTKFVDLQVSTGNSYHVSKIIDDKNCAERLRQANLAFRETKHSFVFDHFDVFYSITENAKKVQLDTVFRAMKILWESTDSLGRALAEFLQENEVTTNDRHQMLNALKMHIYATVALVKRIDKDVLLNDGKKLKKNSLEEINQKRWEERRNLALLQLMNVLKLPLQNLWMPPVPEEDFVNLCAEFAYRTLEHPTIKEKETETTVYGIFGSLLKSFNHSIIFPVRIVELIRSNESAALSIAAGIIELHEAGFSTIIKTVVNELINSLDGDVTDAAVIKNISIFFNELGDSQPSLIMPYVRETAADILNLDSHQLRICYLKLMKKIVVDELTAENLTEDQKEIRDEYLDHLRTHIHDVNAHVRQKALECWCELKGDDAVPLVWMFEIVELTACRLEDKSSLVRKTAIQLIKLFLDRNPYAAKFSIEELEERYEAKRKELSDLRMKMNDESDKQEGLSEKWEEITVEMNDPIDKVLGMESIDDEGVSVDECAHIYELFPKLLEEKDYWKIVLLFRRFEELNGSWKEVAGMDKEHAKTYFFMVIKTHFLMQNQCKDYENEYKNTESAVRFLEDSLKFSAVLVKAVPKLQELLMSKSESDVNEAIDFFTSAFLFGIKNTEVGMRQLLFLVWSVSKDKRGPIRDAYKRILFDNDHQGRAQAFRTVMNILRFIENLTFSQFIAFEELIKEFVVSEEIDTTMIQVMFEIYTKKLENITNNDSRLALQLLVVCSNANPSIVRSNCALIEELCFDKEEGLKDSRVFSFSLDFMMNFYADRADLYPRLEGTHARVNKVVKTFCYYFLSEDSSNFDDVCSKTFQYIYKMCSLPNKISEDIIRDIYGELCKLSEEYGNDGVDKANLIEVDENPLSQGVQARASQASQMSQYPRLSQNVNEGGNLLISTKHLSRFIFIIGYTAMRELIYLDVDVFMNLKSRQEITELKNNKKKQDDPNKRKSTMNSSVSAITRKSLMLPGPDDDENDDDVVGQSSDDVFAEQINAIFEQEMLFSKESFFRRFFHVIMDVLKHPRKYNNEELQRSSLLAMLHFMSVSSEFCDKHMQFLFNVFSHTQDIEMKCNVIIGLSDLTFRFPNVIEPWSSSLYATLHDDNRDIRLTAVRILAHLISHEMILVKGQISDLALCLVDQDDEIRQSTEVFFKEIAHKSAILYNVLPDIISRLSDPKWKLEEGKYQTIMRYIFGLISKDRQIEGLVDKLCCRFKITQQERQWRDIAYCLSLLSYNEKTMKKLTDNIVTFRDKVQVQEIYDYFRTIIADTSKLAKPELKAAVQDFEMKLEECLAVNENPDQDANDTANPRPSEIRKAPTTSKRGGRTAQKNVGKKPAARGGRGRKIQQDSSESSESEDNENLPPPSSKGARRVRKERIIEESDDEPERTRKTPVRVPRSKVIHETSSSASDSVSSMRPTRKRSRR